MRKPAHIALLIVLMMQAMVPVMHVLTMLVMTTTIGATSAVTDIRVGVMLIDDRRVPYSVHRVGPAVDVAMATVNREHLNSSYRLVSVLRVYDDICSARYATGESRSTSHCHGWVTFYFPLSQVGHVLHPIVTGESRFNSRCHRGVRFYPPLAQVSHILRPAVATVC